MTHLNFRSHTMTQLLTSSNDPLLTALLVVFVLVVFVGTAGVAYVYWKRRHYADVDSSHDVRLTDILVSKEDDCGETEASKNGYTAVLLLLLVAIGFAVLCSLAVFRSSSVALQALTNECEGHCQIP